MEPARPARPSRPLGTMIAFGFPRGNVEVDLAIALRIGAAVLEILPCWAAYPDPAPLRARAADLGLAIRSAHGCWGGQSIRADRVDLASTDPAARAASVDDLRRCLDWLHAAGGTHLVVHPGGLSDPEEADARRAALRASLEALADHAAGRDLVVCVENMPPGVHPGSRMADLAALVGALDRPEVALAVDTGHAHLHGAVVEETRAAGRLLATTHVHDNEGRADAHWPPGAGTIAWDAWVDSLDKIGYRGPVVLECIRHLRQNAEAIDEAFLLRLDRLTRRDERG